MNNSILFISTVFPDFEGSTRGIFIKNMANEISHNGFIVDILTPKIFNISNYIEKNTFGTIYRFPFLSGEKPLYKYKKVPIIRMITYLFSGAWKLLRLMKKNNYKLIHAHWVIPTGLIGIIGSILFNKPLLVTAHGSDLLDWGKRKLLKNITKFVLKYSYFVIVNSRAMYDTALELGADKQKTSVIYASGIDIEKFNSNIKDTDILRSYNISDSEFVILFVGQLIERKRIKDLINALGIIKNNFNKISLCIIGDGEERDNLEKIAIKLNLKNKVIFIGSVQNEKLPYYYTACDLFVLPSRQEGMGVVLLEAMACGKPVIGSDVDGIKSIIQNGFNGMLFKSMDVEDLAENIKFLYNNEKERVRLAKNARKVVENKYSNTIQIKKILKIYSKVINKKK